MYGHIWPIFPAFWGLFWVAVVGLVIWAKRTGRWGPRHAAATPAPPAASPTASAERILAERYARGELSDQEYMERVSVLRS
ncbi:SHOCT domain-containing protein [Nonomuraea sp. NBC_01738]|uniref:SHOCT domain-containing protein n=1 Tax=Nonomuraea sp. NBC_01738 TaxID=2976003 RepID=UPI002E14768D|nr:SHOCT domain-containing protein [Nonomuraea sp. NBC_01738]